MFTASKFQIATYLLGVCPFSIAFLVFLNSSVSFVVTDLIGQKHGVGDAVGSLGFADELLALVACPLWGVISDRWGLRLVCVAGYVIIGLALALFIQASNIYPQLLLARLFFGLGGAAASTMVTAILPTIAARALAPPVQASYSRIAQTFGGNGHVSSPSITSESTITPARFISRSSRRPSAAAPPEIDTEVAGSTNRIAGFVGMFTGCGALIALMVFLPLPARFQYAGFSAKMALKYSFYIVSLVAFAMAVWCFFGLRHLPRDRPGARSVDGDASSSLKIARDMAGRFRTAVLVGFRRSEIAIGYVGGFVARASSVGISLFIPLLVNATFLASDRCNLENLVNDPTGLPDIKRRCPHAYVVAAELTGVAEVVALVFAPIFGFWSARTGKKELPLLCASIAGIVGYPLFPSQFDPDDSHTGRRALSFLAVSLIGVSQIGAIVCSLGTLSKCIISDIPKPGPPAPEARANGQEPRLNGVEARIHGAEARGPAPNARANGADARDAECQPLLLPTAQDPPNHVPLSTLKGSIAGVYSLYGGFAILLLTKVGGLLFDRVSWAAPFYIMAAFNAILMVACATIGLWAQKRPRHQERSNDAIDS